MRNSFVSLSAGILIALGWISHSNAELLKYIYTGNYYFDFFNSPPNSNPFSTSTRITGYIVLDSTQFQPTVNPNLLEYDAPFDVPDYEFSDGITTVSKSGGGQFYFGGVGVDNSYNMVGWTFSGETAGYPGSPPFSTLNLTNYDGDDSGYEFAGFIPVGASTPLAGSWSAPIDVVPESGVWVLMLIGIASLGAVLRIRTQKPRLAL